MKLEKPQRETFGHFVHEAIPISTVAVLIVALHLPAARGRPAVKVGQRCLLSRAGTRPHEA